MALPYPGEVETGALKTRVPEPRAPFDIAGHVHAAIQANGSRVELFGVERELGDPAAAAMLTSRFRDTLAQHFLERHSLADADTWELFASQAQAQVEQSPRFDDDTLATLLLTVDNL